MERFGGVAAELNIHQYQMNLVKYVNKYQNMLSWKWKEQKTKKERRGSESGVCILKSLKEQSKKYWVKRRINKESLLWKIMLSHLFGNDKNCFILKAINLRTN